MKNRYLPLLLLIAAWFGCNDNTLVAITDRAVYSEFKVRYDKATNVTTGTAAFWEGSQNGRRLIFNGNATLLFQGVGMDYRGDDYTYVKEIQGAQAIAEFKITDVNKKVFRDSISVNVAEYPFAMRLDTVDSSLPLTVAWTGSALENHETVTLRIGGVSAYQDTISRTSVTFPLSKFSQISSLKGTKVTLVLERSKTIGLPSDLGGGGSITAQYIAIAQTVYLK